VDEQTFDKWARDMAQRGTRRAALRLVAGGLLGGLLAWRRGMPARAHNHCGGCPPGHICSAGGICLVEGVPGLGCALQGLDDCGGVCVDKQEDPRNCGNCGFACQPNEFCAQGRCFSNDILNCPALGLTNCGEPFCVDLDSNPWHCGACGNSCGLGTTCHRGACRSTGALCATLGLTDCDGHCVDLLTDPDHCGRCDTACYPPGASCINGLYCE
jgi:hypothetical protein